MDTFYQTFGFVAAICAGIIILAVFFTILGYVKRAFGGPAVEKMKGLVRDGKLANVHLNAGESWERLRLVGFMDQKSINNGAIPYQLANLVVFETSDETRVLIRADAITLIEETDDAA